MKKSLLLLLLVAGCVTPPGYEAFRRVMDSQMGKLTDDPDFYPVYYRLRPLDSKRLDNGNTEESWRAGPKGDCELIFEVTPGRRVVRWRKQGDERVCVIPPTRN